jgi:predicted RNase H-like HicB family nuclease
VTLTPARPGYDVVITSEVADGIRIYVASHPAIPHCFSQGPSQDEALANLTEARQMMLEHFRRYGLSVPPPVPQPRVVAADQDVTAAAPSRPFRTVAIAA